MLDSLLFADDPFLPTGVAVGHRTQNDLRHLQARVSEAYCQNKYNASEPKIINRIIVDSEIDIPYSIFGAIVSL